MEAKPAADIEPRLATVQPTLAQAPPLPEPAGIVAPDALEPPGHPRRRIMELVRSQPGLSITDLAGITGLGHTTVCHHLAVLMRRAFVVRERWGGTVRVFPSSLSPTHRSLLALARSGRTGDVLVALAQDPRSTPASLARRLGLHRQAVQWHLARLERAGVVRVDRDHRPYRLALTIRPDAVMRLLPADLLSRAEADAAPAAQPGPAQAPGSPPATAAGPAAWPAAE